MDKKHQKPGSKAGVIFFVAIVFFALGGATGWYFGALDGYKRATLDVPKFVEQELHKRGIR